MKTFPLTLLYVFYGLTAVVFLFKFIRGKEWNSLDWRTLKTSWQPFALGIVPLTAALIGAKFAGMDLGDIWEYFAGAAAISFVLSQIGVRSQLRAMLLLMGAVAVGLFHPTDNALPMTGTIAGLCAWKLIENLLHKPESRLDDITAPIVWLTTCYYSTAQMSAEGAILCQAEVLSALTTTIFIQWVEPILLPNDTIYLKRVMLSITGGLTMLIIVTKILLDDKLSIMAALVGTGLFISYLLQALDKSADEGPTVQRALKNILLVGIATLAATRLFGMEGLLVMAATTLVGPSTGSAVIAGLYWIARVLVQGYVVIYVPNVTGINLMHTYSSAAMYAGLLFVVVASLFIRDFKNRKTLSAILLATGALVPCASNYFLHSEPTGSLLVAMGVASVLLAYLTPALYPTRAADQENLMIFPVLGTTLAVLAGGLVETGGAATNETRMIALGWIGFVVACIALVDRFVFSKDNKPKDSAPPSSTSDVTA